MRDLMTQVDHYCERTDFSFFAEPFNFYSNALFWVAAFAAYHHLRQNPPRSALAQQGLLILLLLVGLASACFHSLATGWAELADVGFISLFVLWFMWIWFQKVRRFSLGKTLGLFVLFGVLTGIFQLSFANEHFYGSQGYFALALFLGALGWHQHRQLSGSKTLLSAAVLFIISLSLRTLDQPLCSLFPLGTHVFWHSFNAGVCYLSIRALQEEEARAAALAAVELRK